MKLIINFSLRNFSDGSVNGWGWRFWVHGLMPPSFLQGNCSDRDVLSKPSMPLIMFLLESNLEPPSRNILLRLGLNLVSCIKANTQLTPKQRIWAIQKLHAILTSRAAPAPCDPLLAFLSPLMHTLLKQNEYEEPQVRSGLYLMHSEYLKHLTFLCCNLQLDRLIPSLDSQQWAWFKRYCSAIRVAQSIITRTTVPDAFCLEVGQKLAEMSATSPFTYRAKSVTDELPTSTYVEEKQMLSMAGSTEDPCIASTNCSTPPASTDRSISKPIHDHENHTIYKAQHDRQLLQWINQRPEDWTLFWGRASTIYGWGHNHRGQLGGLEGGRVKIPTPCESLSLLRPMFICGGEQTLYAVTPDGKLYSTGLYIYIV